MKTIFYSLVILSLTLTLPLLGKVTGEGTISNVKNNHGSKIAFIKSVQSKRYRPATQKQVVQAGDVIRTGKGTHVIIRFTDQSILTISPNSMVKVDKKKVGKSSKSLTLFSGKLWAKVSKKLSKRNYFKINTPTATAGVRGTAFGVSVAGNGSTFIRVKDGAVSFESDIDPRLEKIAAKPKEIDPLQNFMSEGSLTFQVKKINKEDSSITIDGITGIKKKSILLGKKSMGTFRLSKGLEKEDANSKEFAKTEAMPQDPTARKKIITWHISNLEKRVAQTDRIMIKATRISGSIDSILKEKKFNVTKISASGQKTVHELDHMASELNNLQNGIDAQAHFLESLSEKNGDAKNILNKYNSNRVKTEELVDKVNRLNYGNE